MKPILLFIFIGLQSTILPAQTLPETQYREHPHWIAMMENPSLNYFETVKAFDLYWQNRQQPVEESEIFSLPDEKKATYPNEVESMSQATYSQQEINMAYKKFKYWQIKVSSNITSDGHILTPAERIQRWHLQQEDRK